jgi:hypothetical protein
MSGSTNAARVGTSSKSPIAPQRLTTGVRSTDFGSMEPKGLEKWPLRYDARGRNDLEKGPNYNRSLLPYWGKTADGNCVCVCGKTTTRWSDMERHVAHMHFDSVLYRCPYAGCRLVNSNKAYIQGDHWRAKHGGEHHTCPVPHCGKHYADHGALIKHCDKDHSLDVRKTNVIRQSSNDTSSTSVSDTTSGSKGAKRGCPFSTSVAKRRKTSQTSQTGTGYDTSSTSVSPTAPAATSAPFALVDIGNAPMGAGNGQRERGVDTCSNANVADCGAQLAQARDEANYFALPNNNNNNNMSPAPAVDTSLTDLWRLPIQVQEGQPGPEAPLDSFTYNSTELELVINGTSYRPAQPAQPAQPEEPAQREEPQQFWDSSYYERDPPPAPAMSLIEMITPLMPLLDYILTD